MKFVKDMTTDEGYLNKLKAYLHAMEEIQKTLDEHQNAIPKIHNEAQEISKSYFDELVADLKSENLLPEDFSHDTYHIRFSEESNHVWIEKKKIKQ